jgi:hypothetical protein
MMRVNSFRLLCAAAMAWAVLAPFSPAAAQTPSPEAIAIARQIIALRGGDQIYDPLFRGIVEKTKFTFMQTNPMLQRDLNEAAAEVHRELQGEVEALKQDAARLYASHFSEEELKQVLAFYQSPLGRKLTDTEPKILDQSMEQAEKWTERMVENVMARMRAAMRKRGHEL